MPFWKSVAELTKIARLHIVLGGVLAFSVGAFLGVIDGGIVDPLKITVFYAIVFFGDLSTHYGNDYFDVKKDGLQFSKKFFSGKKILVTNPNLCRPAKATSLLFLLISITLATVAVIFTVAPIELLIIALAANFAGWFYSAPPLQLVSRGLGEIIIALAAGFFIPAVGYLAVMGQFQNLFLFFILPFVFYGLMLALSLEAADIKADNKTRKKNIGARKGENFIFSLALASALAAFVYFVFFAWQIGNLGISFWLVTVFSLVPLTAGTVGLFGFKSKGNTNRWSTINVFSLFIFNFLMIMYLIVLAASL